VILLWDNLWDNLAGPRSPDVVRWLGHHGILPLYTPLRGSWLHLAAALQRSIVRRALDGEHPQTATAIIPWLEDTVAGWNETPTPFSGDGPRRARRRRARQRHRSGATAVIDPSHVCAA
jgi:hypothetical protein